MSKAGILARSQPRIIKATALPALLVLPLLQTRIFALLQAWVLAVESRIFMLLHPRIFAPSRW